MIEISVLWCLDDVWRNPVFRSGDARFKRSRLKIVQCRKNGQGGAHGEPEQF